jgi:PII-like signaling protein
MRFSGEGKLVRVFIGESDRYQGKPLYQALVERIRQEGLAGATVIRGIEGFGASSHLHTSRILRLSEDLPVVVEFVDDEEHIERILPIVDGMVGDGMVTVERVQVVTYRATRRDSEQVADRLRMLAAEASALRREGGDVLDDSIRAAYEYGASEDQIAEATGLSTDEIRRVVQRDSRT